jgi:hypothetical protein
MASRCVQVLDPATASALAAAGVNVTIFAPPTADLLKILGGYQQGMLTQDQVTDILKLHVVLQYVEAVDLMDGDVLPAANGEDLVVMMEGDDILIESSANSTATITAADFDGCSDTSIYHKISAVLVPDNLGVDIKSLPDGDLAALEATLPPANRDLTPAAGPKTGPATTNSARGMASMLAAVAAGTVAVLAL